jgi:hypothetical protein
LKSSSVAIPVLRVEKKTEKDFVLQGRKQEAQIITHGGRGIQSITLAGREARLQTSKGRINQRGIGAV